MWSRTVSTTCGQRNGACDRPEVARDVDESGVHEVDEPLRIDAGRVAIVEDQRLEHLAGEIAAGALYRGDASTRRPTRS